MPDLFRQVPGGVLRIFLLFAFLFASGPAAGKEPVGKGPKASLQLPQALARTLKNHPELEAFSEEIRAREAEALQAGLRPNPALSLEAENFLGSGDLSGTGAVETTVSLTQSIELGEKRSRRRQLAEAEASLAQNEYLQARGDLLARTGNSFITVLAAQQRLKLAQELAGIAKRLLNQAEERIAAGKTAAIESTRARIAWRDLEIAREKAARDLVAARRDLAARMGSDAVDFGEVEGDLSSHREVPPLDALEELVGASPLMARRVAESERRRRGVALEEANRLPDLEVGVGARHFRENDDTALVAGISIPLPIFDRRQGALAAARSRLAQARAEERSALIEAKVALTAAWQEMAAAREESEALEKEILPAARQALEAAEYGYRAGKFDIRDLLDAQRTLAEVRGRQLEALTSFHRAANELNRLLGTDLPENRHSAPVSFEESP